MSRNLSHLNTSKSIIQQYKGKVPLAVYLKNFFAKDKKYGSRDRRTISGLCYAYYRVKFGLPEADINETILAGIYLTTTAPNVMLAEIKPAWSNEIGQPLQHKINTLQLDVSLLFPFNNELSQNIDVAAFDQSFLVQPKLFIRLRPKNKQLAEAKLTNAHIAYEKVADDCLAFENGTRLENVLELNKDYVVQDYTSQQTFLVLPFKNETATLNVWDCCAASGGKSIMAFDALPHIQLTVSDVRESILKNLTKRLTAAGVKNFHQFEADLNQPASISSRFGSKPFDLIICDAPCSGSGTWSRTPEQLSFFHVQQIEQYSQLQKKIAGNVLQALKKQGYFLYITCSVFKKENEEVIDYLQDNYQVKLVKMELLKGYDHQADSMFVALLQMVS